jgi:hypothetical protein
MLDRFVRRLRPDPLRSRVQDSIRRGTGLSRGEWVLEDHPLDELVVARLHGDIVEWCRERISESRRPYGIDQMALAVACAEPGGQPLDSKTFGVFRPIEFYEEAGVAERIGEFVRGVDLAGVSERRGTVRFAAALFSWGDVAREAVFAEDA